ncbi:MAG: hypothetical protein V3R85_02455 [Alphaproteobacteria bacterium]
MSSSDGAGSANSAIESAFAAAMAALNQGDSEAVTAEAVQKLLTAGAKLYCRKLSEEDTYFGPFLESETVTATEAVVAIAEIMRAADLNTFDLAMWMSRPPPE